MNALGQHGVVAILNRGDVDAELLHWVRRLPPEVKLALPRGNQIPRQRNAAVVQFGIPPWILFVDSDSIPSSDALLRITQNPGMIVGGVMQERTHPFNITAVKSLDPPARYTLAEIPRHGSIPAVATGTGFTLVRREVLLEVEPPWFRCGQITPDLLMEDTEFCIRAGKAGFQTVLDCDVRIGHKTSAIMWPGTDGKPWVQWPGPLEHREHLEDITPVPAGVFDA